MMRFALSRMRAKPSLFALPTVAVPVLPSIFHATTNVYRVWHNRISKCGYLRRDESILWDHHPPLSMSHQGEAMLIGVAYPGRPGPSLKLPPHNAATLKKRRDVVIVQLWYRPNAGAAALSDRGLPQPTHRRYPPD